MDIIHSSDITQFRKPPPHSWVKLNVDRVVSQSTNKVGCGGILRDHKGV